MNRRLTAYEKQLLGLLGLKEATSLEACESAHLDRLVAKGLAEVRGGQASLTWEGIVRLRDLRE